MAKVTPLAGKQQKGESYKAIQACNDFLRMGPGRSVAELYRRYAESRQKASPTRSKGTLGHWCTRYEWIERAAEYDTHLEAEKDARAKEILESGLALVHERVIKLKALCDFLEGQLYEESNDGVFHNVWLPDVKQIGSGMGAERIDIERFNAPIISEFRAVLDDLAKETGGRTSHSKVELGGEVALSIAEWQAKRKQRLEDEKNTGLPDEPEPAE